MARKTKELKNKENLEKMILELEYTNRKTTTIRVYVSTVKKMLIYFQTEGKDCTSEEVWNYLRLYRESSRSVQTKRVYSFAIKYYCQKILDWDDNICRKIFSKIKGNSLLPDILTQIEISNILKNTKDIFERVIIYTLYTTGVRISELINIKLEDINAASQTIFIKNGKGGKGRVVPLSPSLYKILREWWKIGYPRKDDLKKYGKNIYLFPSQNGDAISNMKVRKVWNLSLSRISPQKKLGVHTLRRCFATHALEKGVNIFTLSKWMGHSNILSTTRYLRLTNILETQETLKSDQGETAKIINTFYTKDATL